MQNTTLFHLSWRKYLTLLFLLLGTGFFASGVITWIAANWDYFSRFEKLYGVQSLFGVSILLSVFFITMKRKKAGYFCTSSCFCFSRCGIAWGNIRFNWANVSNGR